MEKHIWELNLDSKISIKITDKFQKIVWSEIHGEVYPLARRLKIQPSRLYDYFLHGKLWVPLKVMIDISKELKISLLNMEKNVISYGQMYVPYRVCIKDPILPIKISPYLTSIVSNLYFDGSLPKDGKGSYYNQKDREVMRGFSKRLEAVFGKMYYTNELDHKGVIKHRHPRIVGEICKSIYNVNSFSSKESKLTKVLQKLSKDHKISFILMAILDEGSIAYDGTIMFGVYNKDLCEGVRKLCIKVGLEVGDLKRKKGSGFYYFHIKSREKLYLLCKSISKKYPLITIGKKEERLKISLQIKKQKYKNTKEFSENRKRKIIKETQLKPCSINCLSIKFLIPPRSIRRYMCELIEEKKVKREKKGKEYIYSTTTKFI